MFADVPRRYELINHVLTLGLDIIWRRRAARVAARHGGNRWADVCTGTGETAAYLARLAPEGTQVFAVDFSLPMLAQAAAKPEAEGIRFAAADVKSLPFPDASFDLITISFATRNINLSRDVLIETFREFRRVLKPGGRFINLETSQPRCWLVRWCFRLHVKLFVERIGGWLSGSRTAYAYLARTIPRFHPPEELAEIMGQAGFESVSFRQLLFGAAAIHVAHAAPDAVTDSFPSRRST